MVDINRTCSIVEYVLCSILTSCARRNSSWQNDDNDGSGLVVEQDYSGQFQFA